MEFLRNLTYDVEFTAMLKRRWDQFQQYAEHPDVSSLRMCKSETSWCRDRFPQHYGLFACVLRLHVCVCVWMCECVLWVRQ